MTTVTHAKPKAAADEWDKASAFYRAGMGIGMDPEVVAGALAIELEGNPAFGPVLHECHGPRCENLTSDPVRDEQAVFWLGDGAETYCSNECMSNAGEAQAVQG